MLVVFRLLFQHSFVSCLLLGCVFSTPIFFFFNFSNCFIIFNLLCFDNTLSHFWSARETNEQTRDGGRHDWAWTICCVHIWSKRETFFLISKKQKIKSIAREQLLWMAARASMAAWTACSAHVTARVTAPTSKAWSQETMDCSSTTRPPAPPQPKLLPAPPPQVSLVLLLCPPLIYSLKKNEINPPPAIPPTHTQKELQSSNTPPPLLPKFLWLGTDEMTINLSG